MADRTIKIVLDASVTGLVNGFKTASTAASDFGNKLSDGISKNEQHINTLSNTLGGIGLGLTAGFGFAVKTFMDFDQAMSNVAATGEDARGSLAALREAAIQAGADTAFSATEAAQGIEELAKAGLSAADILDGGLAGALDLAAAGGLSVADAAQYASTAMAQFGLDGRDVTHIADLLAAGAGKANGEVSDMGAALNQAGLVAAQTGLSIEETTGSLAAFAQAGLLGSDAGTSLKTMLQRLSAPSGEAAGLMEELGISAYDASGNFVGMANFAGQLTDALGAMTPAQRNAAMATIFGSDAVRAAGVIYQNGESGIRDWITAVDDQGYAAETAAQKLDNLKGDIEGLGGSLETAFINGGTAANEMLRSMVQGADNLVDAIGGLPTPILNATTLLVGGGGLVALGAAGLGKLVIGINNVKVALSTMGISAKTAGLAVGAIGGALAIAAVGLTVWASNAAAAKARTEELQGTLDEFGRTTDATLSAINTFLTEDRSNWLDGIFGKDPERLVDVAERYGIAIQDLQGYILGQADATDRVNEATSAYLDGLDRTGREYENKKAGIDQFTGSLDGYRTSLENSMTAEEKKIALDQMAGIATTEATAATTAYSEALAAQSEASAQWIEDTSAVFSSFVDLGTAYQSVIDKNMEYATSTADATSSSEDSWEDYYDGVSVSAADFIGSLQAQVAAQEAWATNMTALSTRVNTTMSGDMRSAANNMIDELMKLGPEGAAQVQLLHDMSDAELLQVVELYQRKGRASGDEFADEIANTRPGAIPVDANTDPAYAALNAFLNAARSQSVTIQARIAADPSYSPATSQNMIPRASGGPVTAGTRYLVGEVGPELFIPKQSGTIVNAADTARAMRSNTSAFTAPPTINVNAPASRTGGSDVHVNVNADGLTARGYAEQIADRVVTKQRDTMALYGIGGAP